MSENENAEEIEPQVDVLEEADHDLANQLGFEEDYSEFEPAELAELFDKEISVDTLPYWTNAEEMPWSNRKEFCKFLGVGESTFFGWLKGNRIPKMVKLIIGLFMQQGQIKSELKSQIKDLDKLKNRDRLVRDGNRFMIVAFDDQEGSNDLKMGRIIARDIPDEESARRLMERDELIEFLNTLDEQEWLWVRTGRHSALDYVKGHFRNELRLHIGKEPEGRRIGR